MDGSSGRSSQCGAYWWGLLFRSLVLRFTDLVAPESVGSGGSTHAHQSNKRLLHKPDWQYVNLTYGLKTAQGVGTLLLNQLLLCPV